MPPRSLLTGNTAAKAPILAAATWLLVACAGDGTSGANDGMGRMAPCPSSPNCVSSLADPSDGRHYVEALRFRGDPDAAWDAARAAVRALPRTGVVVHEPGYLAAECRSALFRFVDDLELRLDRENRRIDVRSASRLGYGDMGVNRKRVERLREILASEGIAP